jgi:hypothetical protein
MLEWVVIPFDRPVQAGQGSIVGLSSFRGASGASEPGIQLHALFLDSGFAPRGAPRNDAPHVSTSPVLDPLAAESLRPCGRPK